MSTANERVRSLRKELDLTMEEFASKLGVTRASISNIENGNRNLTSQMASSISNKFGISEDWLRTGSGEMRIKTINDSAAKFAEENGLGELEETLIREYLRLSENERNVFRRYLKNVVAEIKTAAVEELTIDQKVSDYRRELEEEAASGKSEASQTGSEGTANEA